MGEREREREREQDLSDVLGTIPCYALLDTGLTYQGVNPATGWTGERCALLLRQRQSRLQESYEALSSARECSAKP